MSPWRPRSLGVGVVGGPVFASVVALGAGLGLAPAAARAESYGVGRTVEIPRNYGNFRIGASSANENGRPELCLDVSPVRWFSIEGCGTGSGFLHRDDDAEIAHFRAKVPVHRTRAAGADGLVFHLAAGFGELQVARDDPGFQFGGTDARQVSTAGPEVGGAAQALVGLGAGFELVFELSLSVGYFRHAPALVRPADPLQPAASFTVGGGF